MNLMCLIFCVCVYICVCFSSPVTHHNSNNHSYNLLTHPTRLFALNSIGSLVIANDVVTREHIAWGLNFVKLYKQYTSYKCPLTCNRVIRVGYLSADFFTHSVSYFVEVCCCLSACLHAFVCLFVCLCAQMCLFMCVWLWFYICVLFLPLFTHISGGSSTRQSLSCTRHLLLQCTPSRPENTMPAEIITFMAIRAWAFYTRRT